MTHSENQSGLSRRQFLQGMAAIGGSAMAYQALYTLGITPPSSYKAPLRLQGQANGQRVIILGAGLAGLTAAYELNNAGYECVVLEARGRAGGRCWTVRGGDTGEEASGDQQTSTFDDGLFFNAGPDRIPQEHRAVLAYCKAFNIPLRSFVTLNTATYYYNEGVGGALDGQPVRLGRAWIDMEGYVTELLAQAVHQGALDEALAPQHQETLIAALISIGDLTNDLRYTGSTRAGFSTPAGANTASGTPLEPLARHDLLRAQYWPYFPIDWDLYQQPNLLHPVEGMDSIVRAFEAQIGQLIQYQAEVQEIRREADGVRIVYIDHATGEMQAVSGDYCICTIPLPVLAGITSDFPQPVQEAIASIAYVPAVKVGLQFSPRFWEDVDYIYGGGTFTNLSIGQIGYPSHGYHSEKGIMDGAYAIGEAARVLGDLSPAARIEEALTHGAKIHPQYPEAFETGFSVAWQNMPYSQGAWAVYSTEQRADLYPLLFDFDERIHLAGDHMSYLNGWMEGAVLSAHAIVEQIHARATT